MASPSLSSALSFVKKYPITLCGLSLLFMPSVHHLLLYFTPLLLSTAIFVVAMVSWGPGPSEEKTTSRRRRPRLLDEHHEWAFDESMASGDDDDDRDESQEEEGDGEGGVAMADEASKLGSAGMDLDRQEDSGKEEAGPDVGLGRGLGGPAAERSKVERDHSMSAADSEETVDCHACEADQEPDLPDGSASANLEANACHNAGPNNYDAKAQSTNQGGSQAPSSNEMSYGHHHPDCLSAVQHTVPTQKPSQYLQVCA